MVAGLAIWTLLMSIVTAILYVWDKRSAIKDHPRVPEKTLLAFSLLGGWPGGWLAGRAFRHKTQKRSYRIRFAVCAMIHSLGVLAVLTRWS